MDARRIEYLPLDDIVGAARNPKRHTTDGLIASIGRFGYATPALRDERTGRLVVGHGRTEAVRQIRDAGEGPPSGVRVDDDGRWLVPVVCGWASRSDAEAEAYLVADNRHTELGGWDHQELAELLADVQAFDPDLIDVTGWDLADIDELLGGTSSTRNGAGGADEDRPTLADRFLLPPFDVLDTRQGWWQDRKRTWLSLGFRSEIGRGKNLAFADVSSTDPTFYSQKAKAEKEIGRELTFAEFKADYYQQPDSSIASGTSVFDPVLCELAYRWYSPADGVVIDPFAGGSVRGLMASLLGRHYIGNDLCADQVAENRKQADEFHATGLITAAPTWSVGDSAQWVGTLPPNSADMILTCPPYYDLEAYSDDPADLSAMTYDEFDRVFADILAGAAAALRPDRFAVIVVGDARDTRGHLHDLRGSTVRAATRAGLAFCSGAVLVNMVGSAAMRAARQFSATRTLCRMHQDVLVFCKGDRSRATKACGSVDVHLPEGMAWENEDD